MGTSEGVREIVKQGDKVNYSSYSDSSGYANSAGNIPDVTPYNNHLNDTSNPHGVNCSQIGAAAWNHSHSEYASSSHDHDGRYAYASDVGVKFVIKQSATTYGTVVDMGIYCNLVIICSMNTTNSIIVDSAIFIPGHRTQHRNGSNNIDADGTDTRAIALTVTIGGSYMTALLIGFY